MKTEKYAISRAIHGISLNGREYCLDEDNNTLLFDSFQSAKDFLAPFYSKEDLDSDLEGGSIFIEVYSDQ